MAIARATRVASASAEAYAPRRLRMRDLVRESGLPRETIHFYLAQGLLPPAIKTGRNTALYGEEHLERLRKIRDLRERQFLPLKAIHAILDGGAPAAGDFTPAQQDLIRRVRSSLEGLGPEAVANVPVGRVTRGKVSAAELRRLHEAGIISLAGRGRLSADDAEVVAAWVRLKEIGIGPEQGFEPGQIRIYADAVERMVRDEVEIFSERYAGVAGKQAARTVEQAVPILNGLIAALHRKTLRRFFADFPGNERKKRS
jgi:DNA-binding transcriptional MerR regulator